MVKKRSLTSKSKNKAHKLYFELLTFLFIILIIFSLYLFYKQASFEKKILEEQYSEKDIKTANEVLKVLIGEYKGYNNSYEEIKLFYKKNGCLLNVLLKENCNVYSYNKVYSFKLNNNTGLLGYAIFKNQTLLESFLEQTKNILLLKAQKENYSLILYDLNVISTKATNTNSQVLMLLKDIYNKKDSEYYIFFWKNNILWFVKETSSKETFIRRSLGDSTNFNHTKNYVEYYNLTLP